VLARLEDLKGVERAEVDFAADFLRVSVRDDAAQASAVALLAALGYGAELADRPAIAKWYDRSSVGELSRVEAEVIAERVITRFAAGHASDRAVRLAATEAIAEALHACFTGIQLAAGPSSPHFRADCVARSVAALTPIVGQGDARELGRLLDDDMGQLHRSAL